MVGTMIQNDTERARVEAILSDHRLGLHAEHERDDGCKAPGCDDAWWAYARAQENEGTPWDIF